MPAPTAPPRPARARSTGPVRGTCRVPGDKSISHRALMLGSQCLGTTRITGLLEGEDVLATAAALGRLGVTVEREGPGHWRVDGVGVGGLAEPDDVLAMGNSGTSARLLAGLLATHPFAAVMTGDGSLRRRPMARITEPLGQFGARFVARSGTRLPLTIMGAAEPVPITYRVPVASAQVKSAVLLAGLNTPGRTVVVERTPTRDYTETMLGAVGAAVVTEVVPAAEGGGHRISLDGQPVLVAPPDPVTVPGDVSSAAFLIVLAAILPDSDLVLDGIGLNPRRTGLIDTLLEMGADLEITDRRQTGGEEIGAVRVRSAPLRGVAVPPSRAAAMIDEYPILCIAAAAADGETRMAGVGELRVKESDRIQLMQAGLAACGVTVASGPDWLSVTGAGAAARVPGGARVETALDHRIAMSFLVLGCAAKAPVEIDDLAPIQTSFPGFADVIAGLAPAPPIEALADGSTP